MRVWPGRRPRLFGADGRPVSSSSSSLVALPVPDATNRIAYWPMSADDMTADFGNARRRIIDRSGNLGLNGLGFTATGPADVSGSIPGKSAARWDQALSQLFSMTNGSPTSPADPIANGGFFRTDGNYSAFWHGHVRKNGTNQIRIFPGMGGGTGSGWGVFVNTNGSVTVEYGTPGSSDLSYSFAAGTVPEMASGDYFSIGFVLFSATGSSPNRTRRILLEINGVVDDRTVNVSNLAASNGLHQYFGWNPAAGNVYGADLAEVFFAGPPSSGTITPDAHTLTPEQLVTLHELRVTEQISIGEYAGFPGY